MTTDPITIRGWKIVQVRENLLKASRRGRTIYLSLEGGACKQCDKHGLVTLTWVNAMRQDDLTAIREHFSGRK